MVYFIGKLTEIEEDIASDFTNDKGETRYQSKLQWTDVEPLAWEAPVTLEDNQFRRYVTQSDAKRSTWGFMQRDFENFANRQHLDGVLPDCLLNTDFIWARVEYQMGRNTSPGMAYVPVDVAENREKYEKGLVEGGSEDTGKASEGSGGSKGPKVPDSIEQAVEDAALAAAEGGASADDIKQALIGKGPTRKGMAAAGGVEAVIAYLVKHGKLEESDGTYSVPTGDDAGSDDSEE